jgi:hypothetical protein
VLKRLFFKLLFFFKKKKVRWWMSKVFLHRQIGIFAAPLGKISLSHIQLWKPWMWLWGISKSGPHPSPTRPLLPLPFYVVVVGALGG